MTFEQIYAKIPGNGWLSKPEAMMLYEYTSICNGPILEVGCYKGRSTVLMALANPKFCVHCVDPFCNFDEADPSGYEVMREFKTNLNERGIMNMRLWHQPIESWIPRDVSLAYLDGDHTPEGTMNQIDKALACQPNYILIHDVNDSGGGLAIKKVAEEILGPYVKRTGRLAVWELGSPREKK